MSHIPGSPLGAPEPNNQQQPQPNIPPNFHTFSQQQQQTFLAQHQQHQQRQLQSSPPQSQVVPGVTDPEHQRMWQAMDQHVRAHNAAAQNNPAFNQITECLHAGAVPHQQNAQQPRLGMQGFPQQMQPAPSQNPNMNPTPNPNAMPHELNPAAPFSNLVQMTAAQLQTLVDHNPSLRAAIQQHQRAQAQAVAQQHGTAGPPFDNIGVGMGAPKPPQAQHPMTPVNATTTANANSAEMSRQYQLMSQAGQNQGQNGGPLGQTSPGMHSSRSQQPDQLPQQSQNPPSQHQQIQNGTQMQGGNMQMGNPVGQQPHPGAGQQQHPNRVEHEAGAGEEY